MKEQILEALTKPYCHMVKDINKITKIKKDDIKLTLKALINDGLVYQDGNLFYLRKKGIIQVKDQGFGFIHTNTDENDFYVSEYNLKDSSNGDLVDFYVLPKTYKDNLDNGVVINVLERKNTHVLGILVSKQTKNKTLYYVESQNADYDVRCYVEEKNLHNATAGAIVSAKIIKYTSSIRVEGEVEKILGYENDPGIDISLIAEKYSFYKDFPQVVLDELDNIPDSVNSKLYPNRKDFREETIITIDGDDSKDFDDAVCVKKLENGNYYLGVYIADVSEYVKESHPLDEEALFRATSVYLADRVIPMLPQKLSNGICSLNEGVDRLVLACEMEYDKAGKLVNYEISEGIIRSAHRMTYNNVNKMLNGDIETIKKYNDIYDMNIEMSNLADIIRNLRNKKGAIDFEVPEYKATLDKEGRPLSFELRTRDKAEMLIEDFMLEANQTVAYHMTISNLPCAYRIHENPDDEAVKKVFNLISAIGLHPHVPRNKFLPKDVQNAMNMVKKDRSESYQVVNSMMLRAMAKAKYSEKNLGHFGLAMNYYCHFTSPIRRYPDLMVHRMIKRLILHTNNFESDLNHFNEILHDICVQSSIKEREAIDCEREVMDMLMASFMEDKYGQEFVGTVDSITKFGMFVLLDNGVEGLVHISTLDGYFTFNPENMTLNSSRKTYKIGDKVNVICVSASKKKRQVDFVLKASYDKMISGDFYE